MPNGRTMAPGMIYDTTLIPINLFVIHFFVSIIVYFIRNWQAITFFCFFLSSPCICFCARSRYVCVLQLLWRAVVFLLIVDAVGWFTEVEMRRPFGGWMMMKNSSRVEDRHISYDELCDDINIYNWWNVLSRLNWKSISDLPIIFCKLWRWSDGIVDLSVDSSSAG